MFGYTWALLHHMLGGIRHFIWDTGNGFEPNERQFLAIATIVGSIALHDRGVDLRLSVEKAEDDE